MARLTRQNIFKDFIYIIEKSDEINAEIDGKAFNELADNFEYLQNLKTIIIVGEDEPTGTGNSYLDGLNKFYNGSEKDYSDIPGISGSLVPTWTKIKLDVDIIYFDKLNNNFWKTTSKNTGHPSTWTWYNITANSTIERPSLQIGNDTNYASLKEENTQLQIKNELDKFINLRGHEIKYNSLTTNILYKYLVANDTLLLNLINNEALFSVKNIDDQTGSLDKASLKWFQNTNGGIWEVKNQDGLGVLSVKSLNMKGIELNNETTEQEYIATTHYNKIIYNQSDLDDLTIEDNDVIYITEGTYNIDQFAIDANNVLIESNYNTTFSISGIQTGQSEFITITGSNNKININIDCNNENIDSVIKITSSTQTGSNKSKYNNINMTITNLGNTTYLINDLGINNNININNTNNYNNVSYYNALYGIGHEAVGELEIGAEPSLNALYKGEIKNESFYNKAIIAGSVDGVATLGTTGKLTIF